MEVFIVFIIFVLMPLAVFRGVKMLKESKAETSTQGRNKTSDSSGSGMRKSELEALIRDAVIEATAPLAARLDELEREMLLGDGRLDASTIAEAFDDLAPEDDDSETERDRDFA